MNRLVTGLSLLLLALATTTQAMIQPEFRDGSACSIVSSAPDSAGSSSASLALSCRNNPIDLVDPLGLEWFAEDQISVGGRGFVRMREYKWRFGDTGYTKLNRQVWVEAHGQLLELFDVGPCGEMTPRTGQALWDAHRRMAFQDLAPAYRQFFKLQEIQMAVFSSLPAAAGGVGVFAVDVVANVSGLPNPTDALNLARTGTRLVARTGARMLGREAADLAEQQAARQAQSAIPKTVAPAAKTPLPCFAAGTPVSTTNGDVKIEDIKPGDTVIAYDQDKGVRTQRKVLNTFTNFTYYWVDVSVGSETIRATRFHKFWVESERTWVDAINLEAGMFVRLASGRVEPIRSVQLIELDKPEPTYNLLVDVDHDYYVGAQHVLVHNGYPESPQYPPSTQVGENFQFNFDTSEDYSRSRAAGVRRARATGNFEPGGEMHHVNSVKTHPHLAAEPDNLTRMPDRPTHLDAHGGNFQNPTKGPLKPGC